MVCGGEGVGVCFAGGSFEGEEDLFEEDLRVAVFGAQCSDYLHFHGKERADRTGQGKMKIKRETGQERNGEIKWQSILMPTRITAGPIQRNKERIKRETIS